MKRLAPCLPLLVLSAAAEELFPPVSALDPALLMPPGPVELSIAPDGNFLVDGKPRYLLGTVIYHQPQAGDFAPGPGYAPEFAWIYESPPDRDYLQRLGFDTVGGEVSQTWMQALRPEKAFWQGRKAHDWSIASNYWCSGLPTIVDFTCARWSHGAIAWEEGREPSRAAIPEGGAGHFLPYSLVTEEGLGLYRRMWRAGAEELRAHGARPYAYELFNEPSVDDRSPEARARFADYLAWAFGGDPAAMDEAWGSSYGSFEKAAAFRSPNECVGLGVAWLKFCEDAFATAVVVGLNEISRVDPLARVCFQPLSIAFGRLNVYLANQCCGVVMSGTGGSDPYDAMVLRAVAEGKPIVDGETYLGHTRASHRAKILTQWSRGFNASYYFKWERRLWDPLMKGTNGLERLAEAFPWLGLNPACTPPEALAGLMDAKREIVAMQDLFGPRDRGLPASNRVASLFSLPTERLGFVAGHGNHNFAKANALAMAHDAHLPVDVLFEEHVRDSAGHDVILENRLLRYRFLVAAGIDALRAETRGPLRDWVEAGGTLVLLQEALNLDEIGRPEPGTVSGFPGVVALGEPGKAEAQRFSFRGADYEAVRYKTPSFSPDAGWETLAALPDGLPAVARRACGKGAVWYVGVRFPAPGDEGRLLAALAADCGIRPTCETLDPATRCPVDGIEVQAARGENGDVGFVVCNRTLSPRAVRFAPGAGFAAPLLLDLSRRVLLEPDADGAFLLLLEPDVPLVLRSHAEVAGGGSAGEAHAEGAESAGGGRGAGREPPGRESYAAALARMPAWLAERAPKRAAKAFAVDPARVRFLDLRAVANRSYGDSVAGDGKGGWTDQGENCLRHAPWGVTDCNGVPFDFIRPDQNDDRAVLMLRSTRLPDLPDAVRGLDVGCKAEALYFLHAAAWIGKGEAFRYVVRYADGTSETVPVEGGRDVGDWWIDTRRSDLRSSMRCVPGWANSESKGFWALRWENPHPERTVAAIDVESACGEAIPIVEAITVELPDESPFALRGLALKGWGGAKPVRENGALALALADAATDWCGANLRPREPAPLPDDPGAADFALDVNGGRTPLGAPGPGGQPFQVALVFRLADGTEKRGPYVTPEIEGGRVDDDPDTWQGARIPLRRLLPKDPPAAPAAVAGIAVQYKALQAGRAALLVRSLRVEPAR